MSTVLIVLIALAMAGALFALVRGIIAFLKTTEADLKSGSGPSLSAERQNKAMFMRVGFQAAAVVLVMLLLLLSRNS